MLNDNKIVERLNELYLLCNETPIVLDIVAKDWDKKSDTEVIRMWINDLKLGGCNDYARLFIMQDANKIWEYLYNQRFSYTADIWLKNYVHAPYIPLKITPPIIM